MLRPLWMHSMCQLRIVDVGSDADKECALCITQNVLQRETTEETLFCGKN